MKVKRLIRVNGKDDKEFEFYTVCCCCKESCYEAGYITDPKIKYDNGMPKIWCQKCYRDYKIKDLSTSISGSAKDAIMEKIEKDSMKSPPEGE